MDESPRDDLINTESIFSGRRDFDRQLQMLSIAVHILQRDFGALGSGLKSVQDTATALSASIHLIEDEMHKLDKQLVARIATISVTERALWIVIAALIGVGVKVLG